MSKSNIFFKSTKNDYYLLTKEDAKEINNIAEKLSEENLQTNNYVNFDIMSTRLYMVIHSPHKPLGVRVSREAKFTRKGFLLGEKILKMVYKPL